MRQDNVHIIVDENENDAVKSNSNTERFKWMWIDSRFELSEICIFDIVGAYFRLNANFSYLFLPSILPSTYRTFPSFEIVTFVPEISHCDLFIYLFWSCTANQKQHSKITVYFRQWISLVQTHPSIFWMANGKLLQYHYLSSGASTVTVFSFYHE